MATTRAGMRFSPLKQIMPGNVGQLNVAWVYHMKPPGAAPGRNGSGFLTSETTPLVIGGMMYMSTPYGRAVALDPVTGARAMGVSASVGKPFLAWRRILAR
jgi:quinoprotein glucose dehydrogenase